MYRPAFTVVHDEQAARALVMAARSGWLVTNSPEEGPVATLLPIMWHGAGWSPTSRRPTRTGATSAMESGHW